MGYAFSLIVEEKVALAGFTFCEIENQVSCLEMWSNLACFLSDPFYVVLLTG